MALQTGVSPHIPQTFDTTAGTGTGTSPSSIAGGGVGLTAQGVLGIGASGANAILDVVAGLNAYEIGKANAGMLLRQSAVATIASRERIVDIKRQFRFFQGTQVAGFAGMGVLLEGSALDVAADTAGQRARAISIEEFNLANLVAINQWKATVAKEQGKAARNVQFAKAAIGVVTGVAGAFG